MYSTSQSHLNISANYPRSKRNKLFSFGPHDHYNFGDLIFEKVVTKLLIKRAGYQPDNILHGGIISINITKYGGNSHIQNMLNLS